MLIWMILLGSLMDHIFQAMNLETFLPKVDGRGVNVTWSSILLENSPL